MIWRKSSYSASSGQEDCVELARVHRTIGVRDSKTRLAGHLLLDTTSFGVLVEHLKRDDATR
ncbi:DUF397 domain-containing protein [Actinomadura harenae]|uniref:DUF397 domain-containing protein n=1 Tax=Actinomadura harenae TaxID=2483351 RepID=A0A3M2LLT7_9ACTN|nr:DUF397 domain-containing protein [Actinomadura harenae]RMI38412.1 DUF397 domain-containing protein [Actinomadura harenae]